MPKAKQTKFNLTVQSIGMTDEQVQQIAHQVMGAINTEVSYVAPDKSMGFRAIVHKKVEDFGKD